MKPIKNMYQTMFHNMMLAMGMVLLAMAAIPIARASDHLDTPTVIADPAADIGDMFAWMSSDGHRVNLVMDIVAHQFSNKLQYVFHVDSGKSFGKTTATTTILCQFDTAGKVECWVGKDGYIRGDASSNAGLQDERRRFQVFAGLRDDPFFNNVKGTRAAYNVAGNAIQHGVQRDESGCPQFDGATSQAILQTWRQTNGKSAENFLAGWKTSALIVSIDVESVASGGKLLAVWGTVHRMPHQRAAKRENTARTHPEIPPLGEQIERTARPLIKNGLVGGPLASEAVSNSRKEAYNRAARNQWPTFTRNIEETLGLYDGFDGKCGNQWLAHTEAASSKHYAALAKLLADDRIWINSAAKVCSQFLAVELSALGMQEGRGEDCGGRTPTYDANNIFRSLLSNGTSSGVDDGLKQDDKVHSTTEFPFLAAP